MLRIVAIVGFSLTLLCPVVCLADGDCGDNCEAMTIGAVVTKCQTVPMPLAALDAILVSEPPLLVLRQGRTAAVCNLANAKPPPASVRQARLQAFLF